MIRRLRGWLRRRSDERYLDRLIANGAGVRTISMAFADRAMATESGPWVRWLRSEGYQRMYGTVPPEDHIGRHPLP